MSEPLVLLVVDDDLAASLSAALLAREPHVRVERCATGDVVEACTTRRVDVLILSSSVDETAGARLLAEVQAFSAPPQTIVVFADVADPRRAAVSRAGAWEHVLMTRPGGDPSLVPLLGLVDRLLQNDARDARLDAQARQFRALVEASSDGIYILRDGRFAWVNRRFQQMVGFTAAELTDPSFSMLARITAPESRALIEERGRRVEAGQPVEPRYEFVALRKDGTRFDAQVSIAYLELDEGKPGALGIMQDITERKGFEQQLLKKNRELQLLNALTAAVTGAVDVDETLAIGCRHILSIVGAEAAGIALLQPDGRTLTLRASEDVPEAVARALAEVPIDSPSLLARAVSEGKIEVVDDLARDPRITIDALRAAPFGAAVVVPLRGRSDRRRTESKRVIGAAFALLPRGRAPAETDQDLMVAIGNVLGGAVERASILEAEQHAVKELVALDEIALALSSTLDADDIALTVARSTHRLFGAMRVLIGRVSADGRFIKPVHVLDDGEPAGPGVPIAIEDTIMGLCLQERRPVQRLRPRDGSSVSPDPLDGKPVRVLPYESELFRQGMGTAVAVPVISDGVATGALWLGYPSTQPLVEADLQVLSAIGTHVAIATKNANLFLERERALEELRAAQQKLVESEKLNAIGLIAHGVAHDFNNVLGSILGRAQLLKGQLRDAALLKHAEIIEKAAQDGAETVRRIQEIGRQDRLDDFVAVDAATILNDVLELTRPRWSGRGVDVSTAGAPGIEVAGNPAELREVLINLVHNALEAMADGGRIAMSASREGDRVHIRVQDNGSGIPADVLPRIFDPYFTTKGERGTGLGLSVSQSIVRRHGGELRVTSSVTGPERGTTFVLDLPAFAHPSETAAAAAATTATSGTPGRARVLIVDDEENIREVLAEILMTNDHEVITAADGAEALHKLQADPGIDLVFTDLGLPGMSGYEVAQEMKRLRPDLLVGLVTGWGATLDAEKARQHGVDMVISKPFRFEQVLGIVDEALLLRRGGG